MADSKKDPAGALWLVAAGTAKDAAGRPVKGVMPVAEAGLEGSEAKSRARELGGRAVPEVRARCAAVVAAEGSSPGAVEAAASEEWFDAKAVRGSTAGYAEARAAADAATEADGRERAVVCAPSMPAGAKAGIAAACVALVAVAAAACVWAFQPEPQPEPQPEAAAQEEAAASAEVGVTVQAEGADGAAVQAKVEVLDSDGAAVVGATAVPANEPVSLGELPEGDYELRVVSAPVLEDGSTYRLPDEPAAFEVEGAEPVEVEVALEPLAAEDMTKEQLEAVAEELEAAGESGAASAAREQAASAPSVEGSADDVKQDAAAPSQPSGGSGSGGAQPSGDGSSSGGSSSGGSGSESSQPAHQHDWVPQTEPQWVVDQAAWDEQVTDYEYHDICTCGFDCTANGVNPGFHTKEHGPGSPYSVQNNVPVPVTSTVHHDEVGHYEDVVTGYKCSGCGAWQ